MSDPTNPAVTSALDRATLAADSAGRAAGVTVRTLNDLADLDQAVRLLAQIWGRPDSPPITLELLRAFTKAGNYAAGAFDASGMVGACVGFFHSPAEDMLHSHIAGVAPAASGRSVGFALKLHQRAWVIGRGVSEIAWTYDPLVARNAYFNLAKLSAGAAEYLPNFYGSMLDKINGDDDSDRLLLRWDLTSPEVTAACLGEPAVANAGLELRRGAAVALGVGSGGQPLSGRLDGAVSLVALPPDVEQLRRSDPGSARAWRIALRETLTGLLERGGRIDGFDRTGWYIVRNLENGTVQ